MKKKELILSVVLLVLGAAFLTGCAGNSALRNASSWPGLTEADGVLYTANAYTVEAVRAGERLWFYPNDPTADSKELFFANPTVDGDTVYVGTYSNQVHILNADDGSLRAKIVLQDAKHKLIASVAATDDLILVPSSDSTLYAYRKGSYSEPVWKTKLSNELWSVPAIVGDSVFAVTLDRKIHELRLSDGALKASVDTNGAIMDGFTAADGKLYFSTFGRNVEVMDASTQDVKTLIRSEYEFWAAPLVLDDMLLAVDLQGTVYATTLDGAELWTKPNAFGENAKVIARPVALPDDQILIVSESGDLKIYDRTGKSADERSINALVQTSPVWDGESIVIAVSRSDALLKGYTSDLKENWIYVGTPDAKTEATKSAAGEAAAAPETTEGK